MADLGQIDYARVRAATERGSAAYVSVSDHRDGVQPLVLFIAFKVEDEEDFDHHDDPANVVATLCAMNDGVYDEFFPDLERRRADS